MIIHLEKGDLLFNEPHLIVCETGDYEPLQLVLVGETNNPVYPPDFPLYQYPAIYVKYGKYDPDEVSELILN